MKETYSPKATEMWLSDMLLMFKPEMLQVNPPITSQGPRLAHVNLFPQNY